jgi:predicted DNA-binding transcriptional regulator AlpA
MHGHLQSDAAYLPAVRPQLANPQSHERTQELSRLHQPLLEQTQNETCHGTSHSEKEAERQMMEKGEKLLTAREVAGILNVSLGWVLDHASGRRLPVLPSIKMGKSVRFREPEIHEFVDMCKRCMSHGIPINPERLRIVESRVKK